MFGFKKNVWLKQEIFGFNKVEHPMFNFNKGKHPMFAFTSVPH